MEKIATHTEGHFSVLGCGWEVGDFKLTNCTYDNRGKLLTETTAINGGAAATVTYAYDDLGRVTSRTTGTAQLDEISSFLSQEVKCTNHCLRNV